MSNGPTAGPKAEQWVQNENTSYMSMLSGISSYLPSSIKKQLTSGPQVQTSVEEKDVVQWSSFEKLEYKNQVYQVLIIAYNNGFQIWNTTNTESIDPILSKRESLIRCAKVLPQPHQNEIPENPFHDKRPIVAIAHSSSLLLAYKYSLSVFIKLKRDRSGVENNIRFYSLPKNKYVNTLKFKTEVYGIQCSRRVLLVALRDHIYGFDSVTMEKTINLDCFCGAGGLGGVLALGPRWLAFPGNVPIVNGRVSSTSDKMIEVAKDMAKDIASGLYYLGHKTYTDYIAAQNGEVEQNNTTNRAYSNENVAYSGSQQDYNETAGTVIVYDVVSQKNLAHFKAHSQPLSAMSFDPSGSLLVTASVDGRNFNVYQICPDSSNAQSNYKHLYKLQRGMTNASIHSMSFSADSRWISVNSTRGTTHLFAISPNGGPVNVHTHLRQTNNLRLNLQPIITDRNPPLVTLASLNRIRSVSNEESNVNIPPVASATEFVGRPFATEFIYVFSQNGILTQYRLKPQAPPPGSEQDPTAVMLGVDGVVKWDLCRRTKQSEQVWSTEWMKEEKREKEEGRKEYKEGEYVGWLSEVEIFTHSPHLRPLWASPQFSFKIFQNQSNDPNPFIEKMSTKKVEVKHIDPTPFRDREGKMGMESPSEESRSSIPSLPEDVIREDMLLAMMTPMEEAVSGLGGLSIQEDYEDPFHIPAYIDRQFVSPVTSQIPERGSEMNWMEDAEEERMGRLSDDPWSIPEEGRFRGREEQRNGVEGLGREEQLVDTAGSSPSSNGSGKPFGSGFFAASQLAESDIHGESSGLFLNRLRAGVGDDD
ncbi:hypothetical protein PROFUN_01782 [Planoprotostelium fungivorum]|uniref:Uncharacterized protein n=1 Tax=Planoprotostelium fungivorum TaxID=1890364 RepID=A0A2P6MWN7_9EUKA|nr:hypothetical protein PROFUN_01782 [Planoprotostelium fungivorum]